MILKEHQWLAGLPAQTLLTFWHLCAVWHAAFTSKREAPKPIGPNKTCTRVLKVLPFWRFTALPWMSHPKAALAHLTSKRKGKRSDETVCGIGVGQLV
jgi:hypothetical protein